MSYGTKFIVLFTLLVSFGFMSCDSPMAPIVPPAEKSLNIPDLNVEASPPGQVLLDWSGELKIVTAGSTPNLVKDLLIGTGWTLSNNFAYGGGTTTIWVAITDGNYDRYLAITCLTGLNANANHVVTFAKAPSSTAFPGGYIGQYGSPPPSSAF